MSSEQKCRDFISKIEEIAKEIECGDKFVNPSYIRDFESKIFRIKEHAKDILNPDRELKIGIVGQVKAGKSSFLNALVFKGEDILPKAATPMTAALTKISYSENPSAKVVFYTKRDWTVIEENSEKFDEEFQKAIEELKKKSGKSQLSDKEVENIKDKISPLYSSCKELTEMSKKIKNIDDKFGREEEIPINNLKTDLEQYVGAKGIYTPLVKYIEMKVSNDLLKGLQIVDTPGLGDPITSRSEKTKEFLMACDVVFILSPTPQFLSQQDISLMINTLPNEGIKSAVLVGSKFDSVLLDDSTRKKIPLKSVIKTTVEKLNESAKRIISASSKAEKSFSFASVLKNIEEEIKLQIQEDKSLYYTSALLYNAACKLDKNISFDESEGHVFNQLSSRFDGVDKNSKFLYSLSGIVRLKDKEFKKIRDKKESILLEHSREFIDDQVKSLLNQIVEIKKECEQNIRIIETEDTIALQKKLDISKNSLQSMQRDIENAFEVCAVDARRYIRDIANTIKSRAKDHTDVDFSTNEEKKGIYEKKRHWIFWEKNVRVGTETIIHKVVNVKDVITNLHNYIRASEEFIAHDLDVAINIVEIQNKIKNIVLQTFQKADADYNENDILGPVELILKKLTISKFSLLDTKGYDDMIIDEFPSCSATDEEISKLLLKQERILDRIAEDISDILERKADEIDAILVSKAKSFTDEVKKQIELKIGMLQEKVKDKEKSLKQYNNFLEIVVKQKENLEQFVNFK